MNDEFYPVALTIAGSDSSGGAGIQADLRTFAAYGVYGTSIITAITAQSHCEVRKVEELSEEIIEAQFASIFETLPVKVVKTGMLANEKIVAILAKYLKKYRVSLIVDPVITSTSGKQLLSDKGIELLKKDIFQKCDWITPNIPEAELLLNRKIANIADIKQSALEISNLYKCGCVLKGGHAKNESKEVIDIIAFNNKLLQLSTPKVATSATHGTGCTFASAIAAGFAIDYDWKESLKMAKSFTFGSILDSVELSNECQAMYPPQENYYNKVKLKDTKLKGK